MAKKETKQDIINKAIKTVEYLIVPVAGVAAIWGFDISIYCTAIAGAIVGILNCIKLFVK